MSRAGSFILCSLIFFISLSLVALVLSWYSVNFLVHRHDFMMYGRKASEIAFELRKKLLSREDTSLVHFITNDRFQLAGLLVRRPNARSNVVVAHGYLMSKEVHHDFITIFPDSNLLLFDTRSHGQSEGSLISLGYYESRDVKAAVNFMKQELSCHEKKNLPMILVGVSMGGAAALRAVHDDSSLCDALVIDSTYSSLRKTMHNTLAYKTKLPSFPFYPIMIRLFKYFTACDVDNMDSVELVKHIKQPILFIHSKNDFFVRPEHSIELYDNAKHPLSKLCIGPRSRHGFLSGHYPAWYQSKVSKFLSKSHFS